MKYKMEQKIRDIISDHGLNVRVSLGMPLKYRGLTVDEAAQNILDFQIKEIEGLRVDESKPGIHQTYTFNDALDSVISMLRGEG